MRRSTSTIESMVACALTAVLGIALGVTVTLLLMQ